MTTHTNETVYFEQGTIKVTNRFLSTRFKDEALAPVQSVRIGRDPLWIAGIMTLGLILFASRFGDLLYWYEQIFLFGLGIIASAFGYCIASLQIGQHMHERTVLWAPIWTINAVRKAIAKARHASPDNDAHSVVFSDVSE